MTAPRPSDSGGVADTRAPQVVLDRLVRRAQADGDLRHDVDAGDVTLMMALLLRPIPGLRAELTQRSVDRYLALMLDGLRARPDLRRLPGSEIGLADLGGA
ncbi:hypothetical protein Misp01_36090 [Microtetraspora sp. NBRC 13810]|uniref:SbtR family transcriptional regulator n=1 Tax=Microtetraspora sp. NBRC 13810 TaxID=3030990 RepID=UPI0024A5F595|nr:hypothetical protein [Microtetraspora sp. NBRC 13810]GLW08479.1 hypothetical protein Misp01_36090 [Microtetraspora sp. NBRC 13810]